MLQLNELNRRRLAILTQHWLLTKGGVTTNTYYLADTLMQRGNFQITIVTPDLYPDARKLRASGFRPTCIHVGLHKAGNVVNVRGRRFKLILLISTFLALLKIKPQVIHCQEHMYMLIASVFYKLLHPATKIVFSFHTQPKKGDFLNDNGQLNHKSNGHLSHKQIFSWALEKCNSITSVSTDLIRSVEKANNLHLSSAIVVPTGVKIKNVDRKMKERFMRRFYLKDSFPILCSVGVFEWDWKVAGIRLLLEAFSQLKYSHAKLIIVGDGKYKEYLQEIVSLLLLKEKVIFTGYLENVFVPISACDIYCHLALNEACATSILEAMAMGKPVIATNRAGNPEIIADKRNGLLVEPEVKDIVQAIKLLVESYQLRDKLGQRARYIGRRKYNWEKIADKYIELYKNETR